MKIVYMGQGTSPVLGLSYLVEKGADVLVVTLPSGCLIDAALKYKLPVMTDDELYHHLDIGDRTTIGYDLQNVDLVVSYGYWKRIKKPLIELPKIGCINFHPAPLPEFRGMGGVYNFAIYEGVPYWGVSAHFVDESFDHGDLIEVRRFAINSENETALSLKEKSHRWLLVLFKDVTDAILRGDCLTRTIQGKGRYISRGDFENLRRVRLSDSVAEIHRKIKAFWCPPWNGAYIELHGTEFTLVNEELLKEIGANYIKEM